MNWLGSSYRIIQRAFVDMESMVVLMKTNAEIKDDPDAEDAAEIDRHSLSATVPEHLRQVHVEFRDVHFSYSENVSVLTNISFRIFSVRFPRTTYAFNQRPDCLHVARKKSLTHSFRATQVALVFFAESFSRVAHSAYSSRLGREFWEWQKYPFQTII